MIYFWDTILGNYTYGRLIIEADSVKEARDIIKAKVVNGMVIEKDSFGKDVGIFSADLGIIFTVEPKILTKGECLVIDGGG